MVMHESDLGKVTVSLDELSKSNCRRSPPPARAFWQAPTYAIVVGGIPMPVQARLQLEPSKRLFLTSSPVNPQVRYPEIMVSC